MPPESFNPRASREARRPGIRVWIACTCFNPRASREARRSTAATSAQKRVSIHAPHVRRDEIRFRSSILVFVSIHAPHVRRDRDPKIRQRHHSVSIHAPHVRRDHAGDTAMKWALAVSIHAPHVRRDPTGAATVTALDWRFNPRASREARPQFRHRLQQIRRVSIHAPHVRRDRFRLGRETCSHRFNPRASREARPRPTPS